MSQSAQLPSAPQSVREELIAKLVAINNSGSLDVSNFSEDALKQVTLVTSDGVFNCHGALSIWMLQQLPEYRQAQLVRSRASANAAHVTVDIGSKYDYDQLCFDFRARDFSLTYKNKGDVKMTTAGLIYQQFGRRLLHVLLANNEAAVTEETIDLIMDQMYDYFVKPVDAMAQRVKPFASVNATSERPIYVDPTSLTGVVARLNPSPFMEASKAAYDDGYTKALKKVGKSFMEALNYTVSVWLRSYQMVKESIDARFDHDASGAILELKHYCDYAGHLYQVEKSLSIGDTIKYVIYPKNDGSGEWMVICVAKVLDGQEPRRPFAKQYAGLKPDVLKEVSGIADLIFVHVSAAMAGAKSRDGVLALARKALE